MRTRKPWFPRVHKYQRDDGTWYTSYRPAPRANPVRRTTGTKDADQAELIRQQLEEQLQRATLVKKRLTYAEAAALYVDTRKSPSTRRNFTSLLRRWALVVDRNAYMDEITVETVRAFVQMRRGQKVAEGTLRYDLAFMRGVFRIAGVPAKLNPVAIMKEEDELKLSSGAKRTDFLLDHEEPLLLLACHHEKWRHMITLAIDTGLRKAEQVRAKRAWVDLSDHEIVIPAAANKTSRVRVVPLSERAIAVVRWFDQRYGTDRDWLFPQIGAPWSSALDRAWKQIKKRAGLTYRWHDLRHTFASRWLKAGGGLAQLSIVLGHTNIQQTMRYAHLATADLHEQMRLIEAVRKARAEKRAKNVHSVIKNGPKAILLPEAESA